MEQVTTFTDQLCKDYQLWFTSDNLAFFEQQKAKSHSKQLPDRTITAKTKEAVEAEIEKLINGTCEEDMDCYLIDEEEL